MHLLLSMDMLTIIISILTNTVNIVVVIIIIIIITTRLLLLLLLTTSSLSLFSPHALSLPTMPTFSNCVRPTCDTLDIVWPT